MLSMSHLLIVLLIVMLLFGSRLPKVMGDVGKGIRNLREGLKGEDDKPDNQDKLN